MGCSTIIQEFDLAGIVDPGRRRQRLWLQLFNRVVDVTQRDILGEARDANAWRHDEANVSALKFFVELQCVEDLFTCKIWRETYGQIEFSEEISNHVALIWRQPGFLRRNGARRDHSEADRFTMKEGVITSRALNRVTHSVPEIQNGAIASLIPFIFCDNF